MKRTPWPKLTCPLVAILRGVKPCEIGAIGTALMEEGFEVIEIPLNSPEPFRSIEILSGLAPDHVLTGAGTVLTQDDVDRLQDAGGRLFVSPNIDPPVLMRATAHGMVTMPGVFTPTEALSAVAAGASALKVFPASVLGPGGINAIRAVLPPDIAVAAVGGVSETDFTAYAASGLKSFGLGSSLYAPGLSAHEVRQRARHVMAVYKDVFTAA